jgi:hypothetical protein
MLGVKGKQAAAIMNLFEFFEQNIGLNSQLEESYVEHLI